MSIAFVNLGKKTFQTGAQKIGRREPRGPDCQSESLGALPPEPGGFSAVTVAFREKVPAQAETVQ
jgi:hypothetical protein